MLRTLKLSQEAIIIWGRVLLTLWLKEGFLIRKGNMEDFWSTGNIQFAFQELIKQSIYVSYTPHKHVFFYNNTF